MSVKTVKIFPVVADFVLRAKCIACVSAVNIEINFGSDADSVRFPMIAATSTPFSLLDSSVNMFPSSVFIR